MKLVQLTIGDGAVVYRVVAPTVGAALDVLLPHPAARQNFAIEILFDDVGLAPVTCDNCGARTTGGH